MLSSVTRITPGVGHRLESNAVFVDEGACFYRGWLPVSSLFHHKRAGAYAKQHSSLQGAQIEAMQYSNGDPKKALANPAAWFMEERAPQPDPAHAQRIIGITDAGDQGLIALAACQAYAREVSR